MKPAISVRIALRALRVNKLRSGLTMLGIIIGVAALVTMIAVGEGAKTQVAERIRSLGANLLLVDPGSMTKSGVQLGAGSKATLTEDDAAAIQNEVPAVLVAGPGVAERGQLIHGNLNWSTIVTGITPAFQVAREWDVAAGRPITDEDVAAAAKVAVIGETVAEKLFVGADPVGKPLRVGNVPFTIVGVLARKGKSSGGNDQDDVVLVPLSTAKIRVFGSRHASRRAVQFIVVKVYADEVMAEAEEQIGSLLRQRHRLQPEQPDDFRVRNLAEVQAAREEASRTLRLLLAAVASVSLIVGGISIMNIMLVSVTERTREIGLRLAVGARRRDVRDQFIIEALTLSLIGGIAGIAAGVGGAAAIAALAGWPILLRFEAMVLAFAFAAVVGGFFGYYPALRASQLDPIEALRFE